ncbi:transcriptional protein SWT1 isoform X1 [Nerophis ophidion]|uniref:transcriptional protein SWT1 isoform X1 n=1 Tax=Nerophis ophidion TaxID=159077 RepID=UPI002AE0496A|nr:transcriptional protein SWT1 isoform X1 [Nerophis ophidion]XP_061739559.1 transcriptional protein SWT1 isoform X1 [Nerophis ophidion]
MSERKRKHKKSSTEEETSKEHCRSDGSKRKHKRNRHSSRSTEEKEHAVTETPQIKTAVHALSARIKTDKRHISKTCVAKSKTKSSSATMHSNCSCKKELNISKKDNAAIRSEIKESRPSRFQRISDLDKDDQRKEKRNSKRSSDEKSCHSSLPGLKKKHSSPTLVSQEKKRQCLELLKSKCQDMNMSNTRNDSNTKEAKKPSLDFKRNKKAKLIKEELLLKENESVDKNVKTSLDLTSQPSSISANTKVPFKIAKPSHDRPTVTNLHSTFKIPKKVQQVPVDTKTGERSDATSTSTTDTCQTELSFSETSASNLKPHCGDVPPGFAFERKDTSPSFSIVAPSSSNAIPEQQSDQFGLQMQVAAELHLARSERRLEVDIMQSYGELTCMDIDPPEESATYTLCKQPAQEDVILVLDTNILLSHLDYVKKMKYHGFGALGLPIVLIPWVVLQELDSLKKGKGLTGSVAHLACPAISYIYNSLKSKEKYLWGQSMQQAAESNNSLMAENNDDKVLQCCLQYQSLYPGSALILCTNDKNLCSKAVLSGVKALSKTDLEAEVGKARQDHNHQQSILLQGLPQNDLPMTSTMPGKSFTPPLPCTHDRASLSSSLREKESKRQSAEEEEDEKINRCVSEFEDCLQEVLSNVLEKEMKAAYDDMWQEIVYLKPPWTFLDVLHCFKKHWRAVFGFIVPRPMLQTVLNLIDFFKRGQSRDRSSTLRILQEAKEFVKEFGESSSLVPRALTAMDNILNKLKHKAESVVSSDVVMNEDEEAKQLPTSHATHDEVWAMFENIWCNVCQISLEVFKALAFDPHTRQSSLPVRGPPPPQDAVAYLSQMSSMVSQLLQAFISVLSSSPGLQDVQVLLGIIKSNKIVDCRLADTDLLSCFSQQDYREKLRVGVNQLTELKEALDHCLQTTGQLVTINM